MADSSHSPLPAPVRAAPRSNAERANAAPWLLAGPALLLFCGLLLVPLLLTAVLSFHAFDGTQGVLPSFTLSN
ncbi:ABC transporter permease, partial [Paraburkholderia sp. SIMBA_027]